MNGREALTLKVRVNIVFTLTMVVFAVFVWFTFRESRRLAEKDRWVSHTRDVLELSELLPLHVADAAAARGAYIRVGDPAQFKSFDAAYNLVFGDLGQLRNLTVDNPGQQLRIGQLDPLIRNRLAILKAAMGSHSITRDDRASQDAFTAQGAIISSQLLTLVREFQDVERSSLQARSSEAEAINSRTAEIDTFRSVFVFLILFLVFWFLNRELSRRESAELAINEQKKLLQSILDSCTDAVIVADSSGSIILRNPVADRDQAMIHADRLDENYTQILGLYKSDGQTLFRTEELALARALRGETVLGLEICNRPPDGGQITWTLTSGGPLINDKGEKRGGVVFLRDITDRKKADNQLAHTLLESNAHALENVELSELGDLLQSCHTVQEAYKMSEKALSNIFSSRPGALFIINPSRDLVEAQVVWNNCSTTELGFSPDECWALRRGKPYGQSRAGAPLPCAHLRGELVDYLCAPLVAHGETLGVLYLEMEAPGPMALTEVEQIQHARFKYLVVAVAERVSLALANLKLRELLKNQSIRDPLTGLFNRRYLEESLNREVHRAARAGRAVSMVMLDLDHFKTFNDTFGHQAGDMLLKEVAAVIKSRVRAGDLACRYGGEEFSLILAEVDSVGAYRCVDSIREAIKHLSLHSRGQTLGSITISAGIAAFPTNADNPEDLAHAADEALYKAKKTGRDRIVICEASEAGSTLANKTV